MIFALSENSATQELLHRRHPEVRVLWHAGLVEIVAQAGRRTNIPPNRVRRLVIANLLVHLDRQVIVADVDEYWLHDPTRYLQSLRTEGRQVEFAAQNNSGKDVVNSGFLLHRPTPKTKELLRMAWMAKIGTWHTLPDGRKLWNRADSGQLLLNCA